MHYLQLYRSEPQHRGFLSFTVLLTIAGIAMYYGSHSLSELKNSLRWDTNLVWYFLVLYGVPLILPYLAYTLFYRKLYLWRDRRFVLLLGVAWATFTLRSCAHLFTEDLLDILQNWAHPTYWYRILQGILRGLCILIPITLFWLLAHRQEQPLYGFTLKGFDTRPYFFMLLVMLPLIAAASLSMDFLGQYPRAGNWGLEDFDLANRSDRKYFALFELIYGLDFINIELFFRGFLILAFMRYAGPQVIWPMAVFYVFIHFGKPLGETISSFFGGAILGIISYYSRSIFGGIIVHIGIAWLMELGALISKWQS